MSYWGAIVDVVAQLALQPDNPHDSNAVVVLVDSKIVGHIPRSEAPAIRAELLALSRNNQAVTCKARISGGWDRPDSDVGSFCINLSLSRPLKRRKAGRST